MLIIIFFLKIIYFDIFLSKKYFESLPLSQFQTSLNLTRSALCTVQSGVFEIVVAVEVQSAFRLEIYQNNFFYFLKIILNVNLKT
jgi:hypothetical protein